MQTKSRTTASQLAVLLAGSLAGSRAESTYWSDGFETNGINHWSATNGWQILAPTAGPPVANAPSSAHVTGVG